MKVVYSNENYVVPYQTCVALGNFDGVHIAHRNLITAAIQCAHKQSYRSMVYIFDRHPQSIFSENFFILSPHGTKLELLSQFDLDYVYVQSIDKNFLSMPPEDFVAKILLGTLKAKIVVAGFNYRFGADAAGDTVLLKKLADKYGFELIIIPPVTAQDCMVSSTAVRNCIATGDLDGAEQLLGRKYFIQGQVVAGKQLGKQLCFPTINIIPQQCVVTPPKGVYITDTLVDGYRYHSISNVGINPTIDTDSSFLRIETHILDFDRDLYNKQATIEFIRKLRDEVKFDSISQLSEQIKKDVFTAKHFFADKR